MTLRDYTDDPIADRSRLAALRATALLDGVPEEAFDRLTRLASRAVGAPVSLVSLVDLNRQVFMSQTGLTEPWASRRESPLSHSFCQHVVRSGLPLVVGNATDEPLVRDNRAVDEIGIVAYAGFPIADGDGHRLGALCAIDSRPRSWSDDELAVLRDIAAMVQSEIALRAALRRAEETLGAVEQINAALVERNAELESADSGLRLLNAAMDAAAGERDRSREAGAALVAHIAEDVRSPLLAVRATVRALLKDASTSLAEHLQRIEDAAAEVLGRIEEGVAASRAGAAPAERDLDIRVTDVGDVLRSLAGMLRPLAPDGRARLVTTTAPPGDVSSSLRTDPAKLAELLRILASAALRQPGAGVITVDSVRDGRHICLRVSGEGVDEMDVPAAARYLAGLLGGQVSSGEGCVVATVATDLTTI